VEVDEVITTALNPQCKGIAVAVAMESQYEGARAQARLRLSKLLGEDGLTQVERAMAADPLAQLGLSRLTQAKSSYAP
jgi:hypothetical protein